MLTQSEQEELEMLRASAARFMTNPLDRGIFELEAVLEKQHVGPLMRLVIRVVLLIREEIRK